MKKYIVVILASQLFGFNSADAAHQPNDMKFNGKPIDSLCFDINESEQKMIYLQHCGAKQMKYQITGKNSYLAKKGFIGFNWKNSEVSDALEGASYYQFFVASDKQYWVYTLNNGGGTGDFTSIKLVERNHPDTLIVKDIIDSGDRCNGGIENVSVKNHALTFSVNLTAYDLIQSADKKSPAIKAYDDLAACAVCCVAKAFYTIKATDPDPQLTHISLNTMQPTEMPDQGKYASCFNNLLTTFSSKHKKVLNQADINDFADQFNQSCVH